MDGTPNISSLPKTRSLTITKLKSLGIKTYFDLLNYFPSRYENYSINAKINLAQPGEMVTLTGIVTDSKFQITRSGLKMQVFKINDGTGEIQVTFYNQPYLLRLFRKGMAISFAGTVDRYSNKLIFVPKEYEIGKPEKHTGRIVPIYPEKKGLSSKTIREKVFAALNYLPREFMPEAIIISNNLIKEEEAYKNIHFPDSREMMENARRRLAFDELFTIQLSSALIKKNWGREKIGQPFLTAGTADSIKTFIDNLPFKLTNAQSTVWQQILKDLLKDKPMNRFLQGEVGSGKTVVAALACYLAYLNGYQSLFMAPTEILANQHFKTLQSLFGKTTVKVGIVTGSIKEADRADIVVGTHALINKKFKMHKIGLVVVDEQHRFGVTQRSELKNKGINAHLLTMTATPIPRTVALTIYGELDFSVIDEMPKGRKPIKTFFVKKEKRLPCYRWINKQVDKLASQVFIVCPLIEESEVETMKSVRAAKKEFENLKLVFPKLNLGLLHGKLKAKEKDQIMNRFRQRELDILVSTSVVEVGIDIPQATIMIIEGAERFGLAQLHQLRGRVGRSDKPSYCFLFSESESGDVIARLNFFAKTNDGNKLAEEDLKNRGPGEIFGKKQHGYTDLKIASFSDYELIEKTKNAVNYLLENNDINGLPDLKSRLESYQIEEISQD